MTELEKQLIEDPRPDLYATWVRKRIVECIVGCFLLVQGLVGAYLTFALDLNAWTLVPCGVGVIAGAITMVEDPNKQEK